MLVRVSPDRTTWLENVGSGLGVGRTKVGAPADGLAFDWDDEPGSPVGPGPPEPSNPGTIRIAATRPTTMTSAADSHGESRSDGCRAGPRAGGNVIARV